MKVQHQLNGDVFVDWPVEGLGATAEFVVEPDGTVLFFGFRVDGQCNVGGNGLDGSRVPEAMAAPVREAAAAPREAA